MIIVFFSRILCVIKNVRTADSIYHFYLKTIHDLFAQSVTTRAYLNLKGLYSQSILTELLSSQCSWFVERNGTDIQRSLLILFLLILILNRIIFAYQSDVNVYVDQCLFILKLVNIAWVCVFI